MQMAGLPGQPTEALINAIEAHRQDGEVAGFLALQNLNRGLIVNIAAYLGRLNGEGLRLEAAWNNAYEEVLG